MKKSERGAKRNKTKQRFETAVKKGWVMIMSPHLEMVKLKKVLGKAPAKYGASHGIIPERPRTCLPLSEGFAMGGERPLVPSNGEDYAGPRPYARGSIGLAIRLARGSAEECSDALILEADAESSRASNVSRRKTWRTLATECKCPGFPLTVEAIYKVSGVLKASGYRSVANYLDAAKGEHLDLGFPWTTVLARAYKRAIRSAKRNLGPAKQAQPIPLVSLAAFKVQVSESPGTPMFPGRACLLASWWLLREIEASHAKLSHVKLHVSSMEAVFTLPNSKTDFQALGTTRSHSCSCSSTGSDLCPFHQISHQVNWASAMAENEGRWLFPTATGERATKKGWQAVFTAAAAAAGLPIISQNGAALYTGHTARASGACHLAQANVDLWRIQIFGRWSSDAFLRYVRSAPLANLNRLASEASLQQAISAARAELVAISSATKPAVAPVSLEMIDEVEPPHMEQVEGAERFVRNRNGGGKFHVVWFKSENVHPRNWRTKCGWYFGRGLTEFELTEAEPTLNKCRVCFGLRTWPSQQSSTSSSSSDS